MEQESMIKSKHVAESQLTVNYKGIWDGSQRVVHFIDPPPHPRRMLMMIPSSWPLSTNCWQTKTRDRKSALCIRWPATLHKVRQEACEEVLHQLPVGAPRGRRYSQTPPTWRGPSHLVQTNIVSEGLSQALFTFGSFQNCFGSVWGIWQHVVGSEAANRKSAGLMPPSEGQHLNYRFDITVQSRELLMSFVI